jgi:hypothetical protein
VHNSSSGLLRQAYSLPALVYLYRSINVLKTGRLWTTYLGVRGSFDTRGFRLVDHHTRRAETRLSDAWVVCRHLFGALVSWFNVGKCHSSFNNTRLACSRNHTSHRAVGPEGLDYGSRDQHRTSVVSSRPQLACATLWNLLVTRNQDCAAKPFDWT